MQHFMTIATQKKRLLASAAQFSTEGNAPGLLAALYSIYQEREGILHGYLGVSHRITAFVYSASALPPSSAS